MEKCRKMTLWIMAMVVTMMFSLGCDGAISNCTTTLGSESFQKCRYFSALDFTLWWTYHPENATMDFAYREAPGAKNGWVAWGLNPTITGMVGTQAILAFVQPNGTISVLTYSVKKPTFAQKPTTISYAVANLKATVNGGNITVSGSLTLPGNRTEVTHTWQVGSQVIGNEPQGHLLGTDNFNSFGSLNVVTGDAKPAGPVGQPAPGLSSPPPSNTPATPATPTTNSSTPTSSAISNSFSLLLFSFSLLLCFSVHHR